MLNLQDDIINGDPHHFKSFSVDNLLFVSYKCLVYELKSELWTHTNYIAYAIDGEKKWKTPNNEQKIGPGQALFIKKGANTVYQYFDEPFLVLFIFVPDQFVRNVLSRHSFTNVNNLPATKKNDDLILLSQNEIIGTFFQSLMAYFSKGSFVQRDLLIHKMDELILNLMTQPGNEVLKHYFLSLAQQQKVDLKEIMNDNYMHPLTISEFARLSARSLSSFRRDFNKTFDTTPGKWLLTKRLEYARFLFETSDKPTTEVMESSGFVNRSHFTKAFKRHFGQSPGRYRQHLVL